MGILLLFCWILRLLSRNAALLTLYFLVLGSDLLLLINLLKFRIFFSDDSLLLFDLTSDSSLSVSGTFFVANLAALGSGISFTKFDIDNLGHSLSVLRLILGCLFGLLRNSLDLNFSSREHGLLGPVAHDCLDGLRRGECLSLVTEALFGFLWSWISILERFRGAAD